MHASVLFIMLSFNLGMHAKDDSKHTSEFDSSAGIRLNELALLSSVGWYKSYAAQISILLLIMYSRLQGWFYWMFRKCFSTFLHVVLLGILSIAIVSSVVKSKHIFSKKFIFINIYILMFFYPLMKVLISKTSQWLADCQVPPLEHVSLVEKSCLKV
jgi:hypothetical protein